MDRANRWKIVNTKKITPYALILPIVFLYFVFIGGGVFEIIKESLGYLPSVGVKSLNFNSFIHIIGEVGFTQSLLYSLYLALTAAAISTLLGIIIAYSFIMSDNLFLKSLTKKVIQLGVIVPYLYVILLATLFLTKTGFISRTFYHLGILKSFRDFPELIFDQGGIGILWVYVFKGTPFVALLMISVMAKISDKYRALARTLGAGNITILWKIYIPLCASGIIWSSCILFAYDLGSFEVPYLLGCISPVTLSQRLYSLFISPDIGNIPRVMAMNLIIFIFGIIIVALYGALLKLLLVRRHK